MQKFEQITFEGDTQVSCDPDAPHSQFLRVEDWSSWFVFSVVEAQAIYDLLHKYFGEPAELDSRAFDAEHQAVGGDREASDE